MPTYFMKSPKALCPRALSSLEQEGGCEHPETLRWRPPGPLTTMRSALGTTIAVQEHYASNEGLAMMHMKHPVPIGDAIVHLCLDQRCTSGAQDRCSGGRFQLN